MIKSSSIFVRVMLIVLPSMVSLMCYAQEADTEGGIHVNTRQSGMSDVYSSDEIRKITFSKNGVRVWNTNWPTEYAYSNFRSIAFNQKNGSMDTGVETVRQEDVSITINYVASSQRLIVTSPTLLSGVEVYTMDGMLVASDRQQANVCTMSLSDVSQGVYIVKAHSNKGVATKKIVR
jgi:hypothetical protein